MQTMLRGIVLAAVLVSAGPALALDPPFDRGATPWQVQGTVQRADPVAGVLVVDDMNLGFDAAVPVMRAGGGRAMHSLLRPGTPVGVSLTKTSRGEVRASGVWVLGVAGDAR